MKQPLPSARQPAAAGESRWSHRIAGHARGLRLLAGRPRLALARLLEARLLRTSPLFDGLFYLRSYPDVAQARLSPLLHYVCAGAAEGRRPGVLFDSRFYLASDPALARAGVNPLAHYLRRGAAEGRRPNPLFDPAHYAAQAPSWSGREPLEHYLRAGAAEGRDPCLLFDTSYYLERHRDVARSGLNPLGHYLSGGGNEGRDPHPLFDSSFYLSEHPQVRSSGLDPLSHFLLEGAAAGFSPHPLFDPGYYSQRHPEVSGSGLHPLEHYLRVGASGGFDPHPLFDTSYYLARYPEVKSCGRSPLEHYLLTGAAAGCNPNPLFDSRWYLERYPEVAAESMNPLEHYVRLGWRRGYDPGPLFRATLYFEENTSLPRHGEDPLAHFLAWLPDGVEALDTGFVYRSWLRAADPAQPLDPAASSSGPAASVALLMPVEPTATPAEVEATLVSLRGQLHQRWQAVAATPPDCPQTVLDALGRLGQGDERIRLVRAAHGGRSALLAAALSASEADRVGSLDPGDALDERALALLAFALSASPEAILAYADEDRRDPSGRRGEPCFKGPFDRAQLLGGRELGRPWLAAREAILAVGGFREGPSSPEHDLVRRLVETVRDEQVRHLARLLCSRGPGAPPPAGWSRDELTAARRRVYAELPAPPRRRPRPSGAGGWPRTEARDPELAPYASLDNWARAQAVLAGPRRRPAPRSRRAGISVVILTLDRFDLIAPLLHQLTEARAALAARTELQIVVGDTGSSDPRVWAKYQQLSRDVTVVRGLAYHFSRCNNRLFSDEVALDKTLFLNNDVSFADPAASLVSLARALEERDDVGVVGAVLLFPDGRIQHAGVDLFRSGPLSGICFHPHQGEPAAVLRGMGPARDVPAVTGACLMVRSSLFHELGGFDEAYRTEVQDIALCLAARRLGWRCRVVDAGAVQHLENATRGRGAGSVDRLDRQRLLRSWSSFVESQPW